MLDEVREALQHSSSNLAAQRRMMVARIRSSQASWLKNPICDEWAEGYVCRGNLIRKLPGNK